jgi:hypothetical protein
VDSDTPELASLQLVLPVHLLHLRLLVYFLLCFPVYRLPSLHFLLLLAFSSFSFLVMSAVPISILHIGRQNGSTFIPPGMALSSNVTACAGTVWTSGAASSWCTTVGGVGRVGVSLQEKCLEATLPELEITLRLAFKLGQNIFDVEHGGFDWTRKLSNLDRYLTKFAQVWQ